MKSTYKTQINQQEEHLVTTTSEPDYGDYESIIIENANRDTRYLLKSNIKRELQTKDSESSYYLEVLGARFYSFFSPDSMMAETQLLTKDDGVVNVASRWIDNFIPYAEVGVPFFEGSKLVINVEGVTHEIAGYISMLLTARLIGNYDCVGKTINAGYIVENSHEVGKEVIYRNVKIDPGGAFSFSNKKIFNVIYGLVLHINQKIHQLHFPNGAEHPDFNNDIALEMIDNEDPQVLDKNFRKINIFLDYYYPNFDTRDLLINKMSYAVMLENKELYDQLASAVYAIVTAPTEALHSLIYDDMPESINGENLLSIKHVIFKEIQERQKKMHHLYNLEVEYMKLYMALGSSIPFEEMKILAASNMVPIIIDSSLIDKAIANIAIASSIKLLGRTIDKLEEALDMTATIPEGMSMTDYIQMVEDKSKDFKEKVQEMTLLYPDLKDFMLAMQKDNLIMARAILKNCPNIVKQIDPEYIKQLPKELQDIILATKEEEEEEEEEEEARCYSSSDEEYQIDEWEALVVQFNKFLIAKIEKSKDHTSLADEFDNQITLLEQLGENELIREEILKDVERYGIDVL